MSDWLFWVLAAALTAMAVVLLLRPLARPPAAERERRAGMLAVFRDQLAEIARDREQGLLSVEEEAAARLELERRILAEAEERAPPRGAGGAAGRFTLVVVLLLPLASLGLYLFLGRPDLPGLSYAERAGERSAGAQEAHEMARLVAELERRMQAEPGDPRGWALLGQSYLSLGRYPEAVAAYRRALETGGPEGEVNAALGEALTAAADGVVTPEARAAFDRSLAAAPGSPRARYYLALARLQAGEPEAALAAWSALAAETPAEAPWRPALLARIAATAESLGRPVPEIAPPAPPPGPSAEDLAAAAGLSPKERAAFIKSMVEGLAARLEREPEDLAGWLRLARAYQVLGEREKAEAAQARAESLAETLPPEDPLREAVRRSRAALGG